MCLIYIYTLRIYTFNEYGTIDLSSTFFSTKKDNFSWYTTDFSLFWLPKVNTAPLEYLSESAHFFLQEKNANI